MQMLGGCFLAMLRARDGSAAMAGVINGILWGDGVGDGDATVFLVGANT